MPMSPDAQSLAKSHIEGVRASLSDKLIERLSLGKVIGEGQFGYVCEAKLDDDHVAAAGQKECASGGGGEYKEVVENGYHFAVEDQSAATTSFSTVVRLANGDECINL